jgi:hypothetical protein
MKMLQILKNKILWDDHVLSVLIVRKINKHEI